MCRILITDGSKSGFVFPTLKDIIKPLWRRKIKSFALFLLFLLLPLGIMRNDKCGWEDKVQSVAAPID